MALLQDYKVLFEQNTEIKEIFYQGQRIWPSKMPEPGPDYTEPFWVKNVNLTNSTDILFGNSKLANREYSLDKVNWFSWSNRVTIFAGDKMYLRGTVSDNLDECTMSTSAGANDNIEIGGNVMSLWRGSAFTGTETTWHADTTRSARYAMWGVFMTPAIVDASKLLLPVTTYNNGDSGIYGSLFRGCSKMVNGPKELPLPSQEYSNDGGNFYNRMFEGCSSLTETPDIKLTHLLNDGIAQMFKDCTSLIKANFRYLTGTWPYSREVFANINTTGQIFVPTGADLTNITIPSTWTVVYV